MDGLLLNFPTFYHSAIKNNTSLPQFNAVSVLLLGDVRENCTEESIDDSSVSGYVSGKKSIRKRILTPLLNVSHEETVRRLHMLGIQDIQRTVDALTLLIGEVSNLSITAKAPLLALAETKNAEYDFVAEVFLTAVKCPLVFTHRLSKEMIQYLNSLGWPEQSAAPDPIDSSEAAHETASNPENILEASIQKENDQVLIKFSQEAQEVFVSYRNLSIPEDKKAAIRCILGPHLNDPGIIYLQDDDVASIITEEEGFHYSLVELRGTWQSIAVELSRWKKSPNCVGCIYQLEGASDMGLDNIENLFSSIHDLIHEDAVLIFGVKFALEFHTGQVRICIIFKTQDILSGNAPTGKGEDSDPGKSHSRTEEEPTEDPFDDISRIFNKRVPPKKSGAFDFDKLYGGTEEEPTEDKSTEDLFDDILRLFNKDP